jgi:hypothetical protein
MTSCSVSCVAGKVGGGSKFASVVSDALRLSEKLYKCYIKSSLNSARKLLLCFIEKDYR